MVSLSATRVAPERRYPDRPSRSPFDREVSGRTDMDWRKIKDDREKYAAYLCSREWAEKREAVRERAGGKCERCRVLPMDACHHLTYARKYAEPLKDLQAICNPCHEFTHGKREFDPEAFRPWMLYLSMCSSLSWNPVPESVVRGCETDPVVLAAMKSIDAIQILLEAGCDCSNLTECDARLDVYCDALSRARMGVESALVDFSYSAWRDRGSPSPGEFYNLSVLLVLGRRPNGKE